MKIPYKKTRLWVIISLVFFIPVYFLINNYLLREILFFKPLLISVNSKHPLINDKVYCFSKGMFNNIYRIDTFLCDNIFSEKYSFRKDIIVAVPYQELKNIESISLIYGKETVRFNNKTLSEFKLNVLPGESKYFVIKISSLYSPRQYCFYKTLTIFLWGGKIRTIWVLLLVICLFLLLWKFRWFSINKLVAKSKSGAHLLKILIEHVALRKISYLLFFVSFFAFFSVKFKFNNGVKFDSANIFDHSVAVNFACKQGFPKFGGIENFEKYKFNEFDGNVVFNYKLFTRMAGATYLLRPPGNSFLYGFIYKIFGINPIIIKYTQLFFIILSATFLIYLGYKFWEYKGYMAGFISAIIFLFNYAFYAETFCYENVLFLIVLFVIFATEKYLNKSSYKKIIILGFITGISLLITSFFIILPFIFFVYFLFYYVKSRYKKYLGHLLVFIITFLLPVIPWSVYATLQSKKIHLSRDIIITEMQKKPLSKADSLFLMPILKNIPEAVTMNFSIHEGMEIPVKEHNRLSLDIGSGALLSQNFVFISTQGKTGGLLASNNEYVDNGTFNFKYYYDKNSFYNNDGLSESSEFIRIINFYIHYPWKLFTNFFNRFYNTFGTNRLFLIFIISIILNGFISIVKSEFFKKKLIKTIGFIFLNTCLLASLLFLPGKIIFLIIFVISITTVLICFLKKNVNLLNFLPLSASIILITFLIFIILTAGLPRYLDVINSVIYLIGIYSVVHINHRWIYKY